MKIVILGAGAVGYQIARHLIDEDKDVVIIEKNSDRAKYAASQLDCIVINDNGNKIDVLRNAGVDKADYFISVTDSDEINMISCGIVASEFPKTKTIARIRNVEYLDTQIISQKFLGINYIVNPETEAAKVIAHTIAQGAVSDIVSFEKSDIQLRNMPVTENSTFAHKTIREIRTIMNEEFLIAGVSREDKVIIPYGDTILQPFDTLFMVATQRNLEKIFEKNGRVKQNLKRILIVGGGKIARSVLDHIHHKKRRITIIDSNYKLCKELSEQFPYALIINADITDESIFEQEQIHTYDLIITLTNNEELNILTAIYAKKMGIKRAIALIINTNYHALSAHLGIDSAVSPKSSTVDSILKFIRKRNISSVHSLFGGRAEVLEVTIPSNSRLDGKFVKNLKMPENSLIIGITRHNKNYIPDGNFIINSQDVVLTIAAKKVTHKIEQMFGK